MKCQGYRQSHLHSKHRYFRTKKKLVLVVRQKSSTYIKLVFWLSLVTWSWFLGVRKINALTYFRVCNKSLNVCGLGVQFVLLLLQLTLQLCEETRSWQWSLREAEKNIAAIHSVIFSLNSLYTRNVTLRKNGTWYTDDTSLQTIAPKLTPIKSRWINKTTGQRKMCILDLGMNCPCSEHVNFIVSGSLACHRCKTTAWFQHSPLQYNQ